ncbi:MAG: type II secretion system protein F [Lachnospiraceae bacterium]|nr:type II secretion system protein F [Lachnospiraceae bacterium]
MKQFYVLEQKEIILIWLKGIGIVLIFAYFFYRSLFAIIFLLPLLLGYGKIAKKNIILAKRDELRSKFKDMIEMVAGNLQAGYSVENSFAETEKEFARIYSKESAVMKMFSFIKKGLENNIPLDERLKEAGKISNLHEIAEFADVFAVAKNSGGNMVDSISQFSDMIGGKIETEKEISVVLSARRSEQKIMNLVPFVILLYLDITSPNFFSSLYHNLTGIIIMTVCMVIYMTAYSLSVKLLEIEV